MQCDGASIWEAEPEEAEQDTPVEKSEPDKPNWNRIRNLVEDLATEMEAITPAPLADKIVDDIVIILDRSFPGDRESQLAVVAKIALQYMQDMDSAD